MNKKNIIIIIIIMYTKSTQPKIRVDHLMEHIFTFKSHHRVKIFGQIINVLSNNI
jgi:hypothetical protein